MDSPERAGRGYAKRDLEDGSDVKSDRAGEDEEWEGSDKRKHRSIRSRKSSGNVEDVDGGGSGRRRSHGDRSESRKRSGGSSNADSEEEDYDMRKESRSKMMKKKQEESSLEKLSSWYEDGEFDNRQDGGDKSGGRGAVRGEEVERKKLASKLAQHESSQNKSKSKEEKSHDGENDKTVDRDSKYSDRKESTREKTHGSSEHVRTSKRKWDDTEGSKKAEETYNVRSDSRSKPSADPKIEPSKEKTLPAKNEPSDSRIKVLDSSSERGSKSNNKEERKTDAEKN